MLARECPSPYSLASWQQHHTERCWCSTAGRGVYRAASAALPLCGYRTQAHATAASLRSLTTTPPPGGCCSHMHPTRAARPGRPAGRLPPTGTTDEGTEPIPGRARRSKRTPHASRPHRAHAAPPARGPRHGNGNRQGLRRGAPPARACSSQAELTHPSPSRPKRRPAVVGSCVGEHE